MIFKTFDSDIDKWTAKIGVFGKSFNELGTAINNAFEASINNIDNFDENIGFWETLKNNLAPKNKNGDSWLRNSLGEIISAENINSYIAELDLTSAKNKLTDIFNWNELVKNGDRTWDEYFDTLKGGNEYIIDTIKNTDDLSKLTGDDLVKANKQARQSALTHNEALKQQTLSAKAASVAMNLLSTAANMLVMYGISKLITAWDDYKEKLREVAQETAEQAEKSSTNAQSLLDLQEKLDDNTVSAEDLTTAFREQMRTMGYTEEEIDNLINKYNGLSGAIKGATEEALNNAKTDAYADMSTSGRSLSVEAKGNTNVGTYYSQNKELSEEIRKMLDESTAILDGGIYRMDKNASAEDIYSYYLTLKDISQLIQETAKETGDDSLLAGGSINPTPYYQVSEALDALSESAELYGDAVNRLHNADAQLELSNYLKTNDINSKEAFDSYVNGIKDNTTYSEAYKQVLLEVANDAFPQFSAAAKDASDSLSNFPNEIGEGFTSTIVSSVQQIATQLEPQFAKLGEAYKSIFTADGFTLENVDNPMLEDLRTTFSEIGEEIGVTFDSNHLEPFFDSLTNGTATADQVQQAFNDVATAYFYSTDTLDKLNDTTAEAIQKQLQELGVINAKEVVYDTLATKTEALALEEQFLTANGYSLAEATNMKAMMFLNEAGASETARQYLFQLVATEQIFNNQDLNAKQKIEELESLAIAYGQTAIAAKIANMEKAAEAGHTQIDYDKELKSLQAHLNDGMSQVKVDFKQIDTNASSAGKDAAEEYKEALEEELSNLGDVISYVGDIIGDQIQNIKEQCDNVVEALENERDAIIANLEAEKEVLQEQIDAKQDQIDKIREAREQRKAEIDLQKKQYDLERAQNQRTRLVKYVPDIIVI